jgi:hypothetical protein
MGLRKTIFQLTPLGVLAGFSVSFDVGMLAVRAAEPEFRIEKGEQSEPGSVTPVEGRLFNLGRFVPRFGDSSDSSGQRPSPQPSRQYGSGGSLQPAPDSRYPAASRSSSVPTNEPRSLPRATNPFNRRGPQPSADTRGNAVPPAPTFSEPRTTPSDVPNFTPRAASADSEGELTPVPRRGSTPARRSTAVPPVNRVPEQPPVQPEPVSQNRSEPRLVAPSLTGPGLTPPSRIAEGPDETSVTDNSSPVSSGPTLAGPANPSTGEPAPFEAIPRRSESVPDPTDAPPAEVTVESVPMLQPIPRRVKEDFQPTLEPIPRRRIIDSTNERGTPMIPSAPPSVVEEHPPTRISIAPAPAADRPNIRPVPEFEESPGQPRQTARSRTARPPEAQNQPSANPLNRFGVNQLGENMRRMMLFRR